MTFQPLVFLALVLLVAFCWFLVRHSPEKGGRRRRYSLDPFYRLLCRNLPFRDYRILRHVRLPTVNHGAAFLDYVVVSQWGVFIIERPNRRAWVFGQIGEEEWTLVVYSEHIKIPNPIRQLNRNIEAIAQCLGISTSLFFPIVSFPSRSEFKKPLPHFVMLDPRVPDYIRSHSPRPLIPADQVPEFVDAILAWRRSPTFP